MPFPLRFDHHRTAMAVRLEQPAAVPGALVALGLRPPRPVVVLVGGARELDDRDADALRSLIADGLVRAAVRCDAATVDGGTLSGVMALLGDAHDAAAATTPLVGVAAVGTVRLPGHPAPRDDAAPLEPHHSHFVLVPGDEWGAEAAWIADVATAISDGEPSATVLVNGGEIAYDDVRRSVGAGRAVLTVAGSGRTADDLADALRGNATDPRAHALASSGLVHAVGMDDPAAVDEALTELLASGR